MKMYLKAAWLMGMAARGKYLALLEFCIVGLSHSKGDMGAMRNRQKGFSLIELLIVVAIILIIAAIAIPNLLRSRMAANEASAVASLRTVTTGEVTYQTAYPTVGYAPALVNLGGA